MLIGSLDAAWYSCSGRVHFAGLLHFQEISLFPFRVLMVCWELNFKASVRCVGFFAGLKWHTHGRHVLLSSVWVCFSLASPRWSRIFFTNKNCPFEGKLSNSVWLLCNQGLHIRYGVVYFRAVVFLQAFFALGFYTEGLHWWWTESGC